MATRSKKSASTMQTVADNLRGLMVLRQWSEYDLAKASGVAQKTINNILNMRSACTIDTAAALADAFNLSGWQLLLPNLPGQVTASPTLSKLVADWLHASTDGRELISKVAEREAHYNSDGTTGK